MRGRGNSYTLNKSRDSKFPTLDAAALYFALYSIIGWCYEVFLEVVVYQWGFTNRGVLFGPYCPVYGVGALAFILLVYPLIKGRLVKERLIRIPVVFLLCLLIATSLELATSYILEAITGSWPWQTYVDYKINFQGRIALSPSVRFGLGGVLFLYVLQPLFEKLHDFIIARGGVKASRIVALVIALVFVVDLAATLLLR